jgi:hypothetical protein
VNERCHTVRKQMIAVTSGTWLLPAVLGLLSGCTGPTEVVGLGDPEILRGSSVPVSATFGPPETAEMHRRATTREFRERLKPYTCGDPLPEFEVTLAFWPERSYNDRILKVYTSPTLADHNLCLGLGFQYEFNRVLRQFDPGPPMQYQLRDPLSGELRTLTAEKPLLHRPICDCSKRNANDTSWVDIVDEDEEKK